VTQADDIDAIGRARRPDGSGWSYVAWTGGTCRDLMGDPFAGGSREVLSLGEEHPVNEGDFGFPVAPGKMIAAAVNYVSHAIHRDPPEKPELFYKPISSLAEPGTHVVIPEDADDVDAEGEIVLVIGRRAKNLSIDEAESAIFGYTAGFDISARNFQRADRHFWRAKGCDTFSPVGPRIVLGAPGADVALRNSVNGELKQETTVGDMLFSPAELLVFATRYVTLEPGDLFFTGTPGVPPRVVSGDAISVEVGSTGALEMTVTR
jgi:2-keto-4-pentenoate hydratase/2-oxohepta-3-ene-1,7-dioic acid hydratase in catechol pathway